MPAELAEQRESGWRWKTIEEIKRLFMLVWEKSDVMLHAATVLIVLLLVIFSPRAHFCVTRLI